MHKHLTAVERSQIQLLLSNNYSLRKIGDMLNRSASTISRELARNKSTRQYCFKKAQTLSKKRRTNASSIPKKMKLDLITIIERKLRLYWSPDQISGWLKKHSVSISHETIYKYIAKARAAGSNLYTCLRHKGKRYRSNSKTAGRGIIPNRISINKRSKVVENKTRIGDWEADTIIGKNHKGVLITLVDRCSKIALVAFAHTRTASEVTQAIINHLKRIPAKYRKTITFDNGKEFSQHQLIARKLNVRCYFASPYSPWERGLNEHTNGLIRQYIPKKTDLTTMSKYQILKIQKALNKRPRKVLNYRSPEEIISKSKKFLSVALGG